MANKKEKAKQPPKPVSVYCVECGAEMEFDCICDELNFDDGDRVCINGEIYARVYE